MISYEWLVILVCLNLIIGGFLKAVFSFVCNGEPMYSGKWGAGSFISSMITILFGIVIWVI